jgi:hypothetical protein
VNDVTTREYEVLPVWTAEFEQFLDRWLDDFVPRGGRLSLEVEIPAHYDARSVRTMARVMEHSFSAAVGSILGEGIEQPHVSLLAY